MDADWSVEIGEGLPWIEVPWKGWVDLRDPANSDAKMRALTEVVAYPELAEVLFEINTNHTAALTSKCDVFPIDIGSVSALMMDTADADADHDQDVHCGLGSYIDLAFPADDAFSNFAWYESLVRRVATQLLAPIPLPRVSVELVIRQGWCFSGEGYGVTIYAMGFGRDPAAARQAWAQVMRLSACITMLEVTGRVTEKLK
jgi:hypothetical protein